jgi:steroid 5-alpha reductase family enzyme
VTGLSFLAALGFIVAGMSVIMAVAWLIERRTGNSGWIDVTWTFGVGGTALAAALLPFGAGPWERRLLVAAMALAWALRLGLHIASRTRGITDDARYAKLRQDWGADASRQMFRFLQIQAAASVPLAMGVVLAAHRPGPLGWQDALGLFVFAGGWAGGTIADRQLAAFVADKDRTKPVCDVGLWRYSRHPNYFFECVLWASYAVMALALTGHPFGWFALAAPAFMTLLLTRISGIPPLEEHMLRKHGAAFAAYQARTSAFIPWPPAKA